MIDIFCNASFNSSIEPVRDNEVRKIIPSRKYTKAPVHDAVTDGMIKQLPSHSVNYLNYLVTIYKGAVRSQNCPETWKKAEVVTIPKKGKGQEFPQNLRPTILLICLGKIYERILLNGLSSQVLANNLIPEEQFSFMPGRSTDDEVRRVCFWPHFLQNFFVCFPFCPRHS